MDVTRALHDKIAALRLHRTPMQRMWTEYIDAHPEQPPTLEDFIEATLVDVDDRGQHVESFHYRGPRRLSEKTGV